MKKVTFLDIDGVINNALTPVRWTDNMMIAADPMCTRLVNRIWDQTGCAFVLSSSWRHMPDWREAMKAQGLVFDFLDRTQIDVSETMRGEQVKSWLDAHPEVTRAAVIDDLASLFAGWEDTEGRKLFLTSEQEGLTEPIAERIISYLNENDTERERKPSSP